MKTAKAGLTALLLFLAGSATAANLESLKAECGYCHGPTGNSEHPAIPIIAGQKPEFIAKTLRGFQMWDRPCVKIDYKTGPKAGSKTDMCQIASGLTDEDISALSNWYAKQPFQPAVQPFDADLAREGAVLHENNCETCHEQNASVPGRGPRLAGQWMEYLKSTIGYFPTGERVCPPMMERRVAGFSKDEVSRLLNFFASQQEPRTQDQ